MGLTIHYKGNLNDKNFIYNLIDEVEDISKSMDWNYTIIDENWANYENRNKNEKEDGFKGISFGPHPESESVSLFFDSDGKMVNFMEMVFGEKNDDYQFTKTQFAGKEVHIGVVNFLRYIKEKYIENLDVLDETEYWNTNDESRIVKYIDTVNFGINMIAGIAENSENLDDFLTKLNKLIEKKNRK